jgi:hypothetical protein
MTRGGGVSLKLYMDRSTPFRVIESSCDHSHYLLTFATFLLLVYSCFVHQLADPTYTRYVGVRQVADMQAAPRSTWFSTARANA